MPVPFPAILVSFDCSLTHLRVIWEDSLNWRDCLEQSSLWACLWGMALIGDWHRRAQPTMDSAIAWAGGLGMALDWANQRTSEQHYPTVPSLSTCLNSCPDFPYWWPVTCEPAKFLSPQVSLGQSILPHPWRLKLEHCSSPPGVFTWGRKLTDCRYLELMSIQSPSTGLCPSSKGCRSWVTTALQRMAFGHTKQLLLEMPGNLPPFSLAGMS